MLVRIAVVVAAFGLCACSSEPVCPPRLGFTEITSKVPSPIGPQAERVGIHAYRGASLDVVFRVFQDDGGLQTQLERSTTDRALTFDFDMPEPGYHELEVAVSCDGQVIEGGRIRHPVFEPLHFTDTLARPCERLTRLSETLFECDGVVVTKNGAVAPGFSTSSDTRPVVHDGGFVRWLRTDRTVRLEADGFALETFVDAGSSWVAARDFALLGADTVVVRTDAGLEVLPFDAGVFASPGNQEVCAARSDERGRSILLCNPPLTSSSDGPAPTGLRSCSLVFRGSMAVIGQCGILPGRFARWEASTGLVLITDSTSVLWFDLMGGFVDTVRFDRSGRLGSLTLDDSQYGLSPFLFPLADAHVLLTREATRQWRYIGRDVHASSDLAWYSDGGTTEWSVLP